MTTIVVSLQILGFTIRITTNKVFCPIFIRELINKEKGPKSEHVGKQIYVINDFIHNPFSWRAYHMCVIFQITLTHYCLYC
jgi:hypothetical protein